MCFESIPHGPMVLNLGTSVKLGIQKFPAPESGCNSEPSCVLNAMAARAKTPPYTGYGSWDDSMGSVTHLIPKLPKKVPGGTSAMLGTDGNVTVDIHINLTHTYVYMTYVYICVHMFTSVYICVCMYIYIHACLSMYMYIYIYMYTYIICICGMYIYIYIHTHTYTIYMKILDIFAWVCTSTTKTVQPFQMENHSWQ